VSLPDATRSDRVYPLLQNLDLENLAFATVQGVGNTLNIEEMNEDELRRLVLVNLARLTVAGEWNGLLTAASAGAFNAELTPIGASANTRYLIATSPPWGVVDNVSDATLASMDKPFAFPFLSPASGDISEIGVRVSTSHASNVYVAIYSDDSGTPTSRLGYATIDVSSTGNIYQTSITGTITLVKGTQYWYSVNVDQSSTGKLNACNYRYVASIAIGDALSDLISAVKDNAVSSYAVPPATFTNSFGYSSFNRPIVSLKVA